MILPKNKFMRLNAKQLRSAEPDVQQKNNLKKNPLYIICDNVLDTYNVGAIFRLADATGVTKVFLCGETLTPPNPRIKKASINTWKWVDWEYTPGATDAIAKVKSQKAGVKIIAVEQSDTSTPIKDFKPEFPAAVVVGNETFGISRDVLQAADTIVELPMYGVNTSLNVMVSLGIVLYKAMEFL